MGYSDFVIVRVFTGMKAFENSAYTRHAEGSQLGRAKGAHTRRPRYIDALSQSRQHFLVPDGRHLLKMTIDDADCVRPVLQNAQDIPLFDRRQVSRVEVLPGDIRV
jgi:hypothetical protein